MNNNDKYKVLGKIGSGEYGIVYLGIQNETSEYVALKEIKLYLDQNDIPAWAIREISALKKLKHCNIVTLKDIWWPLKTQKTSFYMVLELMELDLRLFMHKNKCKEILVKDFIHQLLKAISFCHSKRYMHRDIKPENILINTNDKESIFGIKLKLADFGLVRQLTTSVISDISYSDTVVSLWYRSPELLLGELTYGPEIDIWSIGCIMSELLTGIPLFKGTNENDQLNCIFKIMGKPDNQSWPGVESMINYDDKSSSLNPSSLSIEFLHNSKSVSKLGIELMSKMLVLNPLKRITAIEALDDIYFKL